MVAGSRPSNWRDGRTDRCEFVPPINGAQGWWDRINAIKKAKGTPKITLRPPTDFAVDYPVAEFRVSVVEVSPCCGSCTPLCSRRR